MTQEQKAKAYDEALEIARKSWFDNREPGYKHYREFLESMFPELCESEDERIRKELIDKIDNLACSGFMSQRQKQNFITYLEKQKGLTTENNMISSKKCNKSPLTDEAFKEQLERVLRNNVLDTDIRITGDTVIGAKQKEQRSADNVSIEEHIKGFKALCDDLSKPSINSGKQKEQKPAEWSEEDEKIITRLIDYFESFRIAGVATKWEGLGVQEVITLLKSLRPSWKPSEEQMKALKYAAYHMLPGEEYRDVLFSLFKDLKELM